MKHTRCFQRVVSLQGASVTVSSKPENSSNGQATPEQLEGWLGAIAMGDRTAFNALYKATSPHLFALLLRMLKRRATAEDALQDCYVKIWKKADSYQLGRGKPMAWLYSVARYRALDMIRQRRIEVDVDDVAESALLTTLAGEVKPADAEQKADDMARLQQVAGCLEELSAEQKRALLLAYYEGYSHSEISSSLDVPVGTVKSWIRRGLLALRQCMGLVDA